MAGLAQSVLDALAKLVGRPAATSSGKPRPGSVDAFLAGEQQRVRSQSGNVQAGRWIADPTDSTGRRGVLEIVYRSGTTWQYAVTRDQARGAWGAPSMGVWLQQNVRVAGRRHAHKVVARQVR